MSDMKCPFCNKPLQPTLRQSDEYWCENYDCPRTNIEWVGSQKLWQELIKLMENKDLSDKIGKLETELDRTRKAFETAVDGLLAVWRATERTTKQGSIAYNVLRNLNIKPLDRIKELEQKESAFVHNKIEFPEFNDNLLEEFDKQFFENGQDDDLTETALEQKDNK